MNLTWHIVKKDAVRLRIPITFWIGTLLAATISDAILIGSEAPAPGYFAVSNFSRMAAWALTVILSAKVILEDPLTTTTVFWRTRPISGSRLLLAKLVGLAGLVIIPLILYFVLLIGVGVKGRELGLAMIEAGLSRAVVTVSIAVIAAVSNSFGSFSLRALAVVVGTGSVASVAGMTIWSHRMTQNLAPLPETLAISGEIAAKFLALTVGGGLLALRYFSRQTRLAVVNVFIAALFVNLIPSLWSWDFVGQLRSPRTAVSSAAPLTFGLSSSTLRISQNESTRNPTAAKTATVEGQIETFLQSGGEWVMPKTVYGVDLRDAGKSYVPTGRAFPRPSWVTGSLETVEPAALQQCLAPLKLINPQAKRSINVELFSLPQPATPPEAPLQLRGSVDATRYRFNIDAEVPLGSGQSVRENRLWIFASRPRINDRELTFTVIDREFQPPLFGGSLGNSSFNPLQPVGSIFRRGLAVDILYVLVNRSRGEAVLLRPGNTQQTSLGDVRTGTRDLHLNFDELKKTLDPSWLEGATLLRVRAVELGPITCKLEADNLTTAN